MPSRPYHDSAVRLSGTPVYLGVIAFGAATKNNADTATPFKASGDALSGKVLLLQTSAAVYILPGTSSSAAVTSTNGVKLAADERVIIAMSDGYTHLAALQVSASGNLSVWELV